MLLRLFTPCAELQAHIEKFWVFESNNGIPLEDMRLIVPNGLFKLVIPFKNGLQSKIANQQQVTKEASIAVIGLTDKPAIIDSQTRCQHSSIGIEFKPFSAYKFFDIPFSEFTNNVFTLDEVLGVPGAALQNQIADATTLEDRIKKVESFLVRQLRKNRQVDSITDFSIQEIIRTHGQVSMKELSRKTGYTSRYLEMKFSDKVGLSPKTLASIYKFQRFYRAWGKHQENRFFANELYEYYFDYSHFVKAFKRFTGLPPQRFLKSENEFGRIFYKG